jgi:hypothetical protein
MGIFVAPLILCFIVGEEGVRVVAVDDDGDDGDDDILCFMKSIYSAPHYFASLFS